MLPRLARLFTRSEAAVVVDGLLAALPEKTEYEMSDYHWLLIHECLRLFCDLHCDGAINQVVGPYTIGEIRFNDVIGAFFFDEDFLFWRDLLDVDEDVKEQAGITREAWSIAAGLKPHPDELKLVSHGPLATTVGRGEAPLGD